MEVISDLYSTVCITDTKSRVAPQNTCTLILSFVRHAPHVLSENKGKVSNLVFYAQLTITVISGQDEGKRSYISHKSKKCSSDRSQQHHWRWQLSVLCTEFRGLHRANFPQRNSHTNSGFCVPTPQAFFSVHWTKSWGIPQTKTCFSSGDGVQMWRSQRLQPCCKQQWSFTQPAPRLPEGGCPAIPYFQWLEQTEVRKRSTCKIFASTKKQFGFQAFSNSAPKLWNALPQTIIIIIDNFCIALFSGVP